ncbi:hypothetical protein Goari_013637 [Gossypium aridum]|uniref:Uncharacterized protein n=1 Tax=Gossypium aridum TaxID=34290 RepID=A0A7J8XFI1_GOSAI|nr:hypothetical protein [Gossypium aridum]
MTVGQVLEVVLAKPQADKKTDAAYPYTAGLNPNYLQHPGYGGFTGTTYGSPSAGFGAATSFQQPVIYGRGPMPTNMAMVPMVLPDGRIGYVLQQPGVQMPTPRPRRVDRGNGPGGGAGRGGNSGGIEGNRSRRKQKLGFAFNSKGYIQAPLRTPCLKSIPCSFLCFVDMA